MEQLAPVLNPREGPPEWYRVCADAGGGFYEKGDKRSGISVDAVGGEALVLRVLLDLNGSPEVRTVGCLWCRLAIDFVLNGIPGLR